MRPEPAYPDAKRPTCFEEGLEFQDFVCLELARRFNIYLQNLGSKLYQLMIGENLQGFEIKKDDRCAETGRLSIEIAEKSKAGNLSFVPSGIYRDDNTWLYIQGNYDILFIFSKNLLVKLHQSGRYEEHEIPTLRGYYLPFDDAKKYAAKYVEIKNANRTSR